MPAKEMDSMDEFLRHRGTERGQKLGDWKKDKKLDTFLHRKLNPVALWRHNMPTIVVTEDDGESVRHVWGRQYVCYEDESVLRRQYKRDDRTGARLYPPLYCGVCRLVDHIDGLISTGKVDWKDKLFRFTGDDAEETQVVHTGGFCNLYGGDLTGADKTELREAGISIKEAWKENGYAKLSYLLAIVKAEASEEGVHIAIETGALGDAIKGVIGDEIESKKDKGNPQLFPYCIRWKYDENEKNFGKKYKANRIDVVECTPAIMEAISGPKPDISAFTKLFNQTEMRAVLEAVCILKGDLIPWDKIFDVKPLEEEAPKKGAAPAPAKAASVTMEDCERCGIPMPITAPECPSCHQKYEVTPEPEAPKPPPTGRRRG